MSLLSFNDASLIRGGQYVLHGISLQVAEGEHTAIVGPNGSGKSSLLKLIMRECYPVAASAQPAVSIFGRSTWDVFELRTLLAILTHDMERVFTQHGALLSSDVVVSGFFASIGVGAHHDVTDTMRQLAAEALARLDVTHLAERPINTLSTGEARRVLIARALVNNPRALLLDEPTEGLDVIRRRSFLEMLRKLAQSGKTLVLVTHHVEEILPEIQNIVLLKNGRIFRQGRKSDVFTTDVLSALFDAAITVHKNGDYYTASHN